MTRLIKFIPEEYFHIYNRGTNKMKIFNNDSGYIRFQKLLYLMNSKQTKKYSDLPKINKYCPNPVWTQELGETLVNIGAYCLMPNHFHLLIKSKKEENTSLFLHRLQISYSKYFNIKNDRSGSLFQGKSKSEHIVGDKYLKYLFSYIHLNPIKLIQKNWKEEGIKDFQKTKKYLSEYKYSSYLDFLNKNKREEYKILNKSVFPNYFSSPELFEKEIFEWLNYNKNVSHVGHGQRRQAWKK